VSIFFLGLVLMVVGPALSIASTRSGTLDDRRGALGSFVFALGVMFAAVALSILSRERVDEVWKEFDTHVKYCQCMTREYDIDRDGGGR
jgi:hypothetical protein